MAIQALEVPSQAPDVLFHAPDVASHALDWDSHVRDVLPQGPDKVSPAGKPCREEKPAFCAVSREWMGFSSGRVESARTDYVDISDLRTVWDCFPRWFLYLPLRR